MNWFKILLGINAALTILFVSTAHAQTYYPDRGNFWYDGYGYADSAMSWSLPGDWSVRKPGYEHEFTIAYDPQSPYFESCTSWTNLPSNYDDCPTAGYTEPAGYRTFSFGSFDAKSIREGIWYSGGWNFSGGFGLSTYFYLAGSETYHRFCWWNSRWCMNQVDDKSKVFITGTLDLYKTNFEEWSGE